MKFKSDIEVQAGLKDSSGSSGNAGSILSSTSTGVTWIDNYADWTSVVKHIVKNNGLNGTITKGTAVYVTGSNGTNMLVGRASNVSEASSSKTMGLMQSDITTTGGTQTGFVITEGLLSGLNTAGQTAGDPVWLGVNGALIYGLINKPYAPAHLVFIGIVTKVSAGSGEIFVKVQNGFELKEIHDVDIITNVPINGDILGYDGTLWVNKTIAEWLGFTPANASGTTNYVSKFTGITTLGNSQIFDNGANVGIGTTSPAAKLHIDLPSGAFGSGYPYNILSYGNSNVFKTYMDGNWNYVNEVIQNGVNQSGYIISTNGSEKMRITSSGNVGIGTTSPSAKLSLAGPSELIWLQENSAYISFYNTANSIRTGYIQANTGSNITIMPEASNALILGAGGNERIRITSAGNVGIGITAPGSKLEVAGNIKSNGGYGEGFVLNDNSSITRENVGMGFNTNSTQRLLISTGGNIGIGTTNPIYKLDVNGTSNITNSLYVGGNLGVGTTMPITKVDIVDTMTNPTLRLAYVPMSGYGGGGNIDFVGGSFDYVNGAISWKNGTTVQGQVDYTGFNRMMTLTAQSTITFKTALMERMRIDSTGQVGIGTSAPMYTLHVNGSVAGTSAYINLSDERYKKDILPIENALDKVLSLNGVTFNWDKGFNQRVNLDNNNHIGLIAQEVEKIIPQAVSTASDDNQTKSVAYSDLVPVLIEAIKELKSEIEELKKLINK